MRLRIFLTLIWVTFSISCSAAESVVINVDYSEYPHYPIVDVYIGDDGPFPFLIDTASSNTSISRDVAKTLGLDSVEKTKALSIHGIQETQATHLLDISISEQRLERQVRFWLSEPSKFGGDYIGLLGIETLRDAKLVNMPPEKILKITAPKEKYNCDTLKASSVCYQLLSKAPMIESIRFQIDDIRF